MAGLYPKIFGAVSALGLYFASRSGYRLAGGGIGGWVLGIGIWFLATSGLCVLAIFLNRWFLHAMDAGYKGMMRPVAHGLTRLAIAIGGRARSWRAEEFLSDLTRPAKGQPTLSGWAQARYSCGLVRAAIILRIGDLGAPLLRLLDWSLAKPRTEKMAAFATLAVAGYLWVSKGFGAVVTNLENIASAGGLVYGPGRWLRDHRSIKPVAMRPANQVSSAKKDADHSAPYQ